jgi:hypothetical protein
VGRTCLVVAAACIAIDCRRLVEIPFL